MRTHLGTLAAMAALLLTACSADDDEPDESRGDAGLEVATVVDGLENPWDLAFLPDGSMLFTQRDALTVTHRSTDGETRVVLDSPDGMWASGETGLMAVEPAEDFASSRTFFTCAGYRQGDVQDVRVQRWTLDASSGSAEAAGDVVTGLPSSSGRHGGCALLATDDALYVGTGDAAQGANPQDLTSGGGKVLRVDPATGDGLPDNPFADEPDPMTQRVLTFGHRNVQGLAVDADGTLWSAEHGPDVDDEVNRLETGGNYGWDPGPEGYDESVPMTDQDLPGEQVEALWSSGDTTDAISGLAVLPRDGEDVDLQTDWGELAGALVVPALKNQSVRFLTLTDDDSLDDVRRPAELAERYGRLRGAVVGPDGALYLTSSNGSDDAILRVTPGT